MAQLCHRHESKQFWTQTPGGQPCSSALTGLALLTSSPIFCLYIPLSLPSIHFSNGKIAGSGKSVRKVMALMKKKGLREG